MAAADAGDEQQQRQAAMAVAAHQETIRLGLIAAQHRRISHTHEHERMPLRIEGEDYGRVLARIPKEEFWHLVQQRNFGYEGFLDEGGLNDFLSTRPGCRVKTISGKTTVGYGSKAARRGRVHFAPGTMQWAN